MRSLLAVPIRSRGRILGSLYLTEKRDRPKFGPDDEDVLVRFATQAALAIAEERERIAREMHDSLARVLGYVNTKAQAIQELLRGGRVEHASEQVAQLSDAARTAYADVREAILGLRLSPGPQRGFLEALREYLRRWEEQSEVAVDLTLSPPGATLQRLGAVAELQLLRIVQEALANVRKHAAARRVCVLLAERDGIIEATVQDDGRGFDPAHPGGDGFPRFGLSTMRERAEAVGGTLQVVSAPGDGTRVTACIPIATTIAGGLAGAGAHR
jgi:signal transduction histidine kinase